MARRLLRIAGWLVGSAVALGLMYAVLRLTVFDVIRFRNSADMWPTLGHDGLVVVNRRATPRRGDLVVLNGPDGTFVLRRVAGVPGDTLAMIDSRPYLDGQDTTWREVRRWKEDKRTFAVMREDYAGASYVVLDDLNRRMSNSWALTVAPGTYFLLADNREHALAKDSRQLGPVPRREIRGVVSWILEKGDVP